MTDPYELSAVALAALAIREAFGFALRVYKNRNGRGRFTNPTNSRNPERLEHVHSLCHDILLAVKTSDGVPTQAILKSIDATTRRLAEIQARVVLLLEQVIAEQRK